MQVSAQGRSDRASKIQSIIGRFKPSAKHYAAVYKHLHQNPELSCQEQHTAGFAADHLRSLKFSVRGAVGGHGVVGLLDNGPGPTVLLRSELDALPVLEKTDLAYASTKRAVDVDGQDKPVMHACGRDMHITMLMAAATLLADAKSNWRGRLIVLFQPNEEKGGGARAMVKDGLYDDPIRGVPRPDVVLGQHILNGKAGTVQIKSGAVLTGKRTLRITIHGRGGHASSPHECIDPVVAACATVMRLQTIVSREVDPRDTAVVTCASIHAGDSPNVVPSTAQLTVDIRAFSQRVSDKVVQAVQRIVRAESDASGIDVAPEFQKELENVPPVENSADAVESIEEQFRAVLGTETVSTMVPGMASDDFSILAPPGVPYAYWTLGSTPEDTWDRHEKEGRLGELPGNHSNLFAPAIEPTLTRGIETLSIAALTFLDVV